MIGVLSDFPEVSLTRFLVENFFQDKREDVAFLLSEEGKTCVTEIALQGIPSRQICNLSLMGIRICNPQ